MHGWRDPPTPGFLLKLQKICVLGAASSGLNVVLEGSRDLVVSTGDSRENCLACRGHRKAYLAYLVFKKQTLNVLFRIFGAKAMDARAHHASPYAFLGLALRGCMMAVPFDLHRAAACALDAP